MVLFGIDSVSLFISFFIFLLLMKMYFKNEKAHIIDMIPGPKAYPIVGNVLDLLEPREKILEKILERREIYGPISRLWVGTEPIVILSKAEDVEVLLRSSKHTEKAHSYRFLHSWLGTGLLTSHGKKWLTHRKLITPTFHFKVLQSFINVFHENANILSTKLEYKAKTREGFDVFPFITLCALDIICETAMGTKINAQSDTGNQYVKSIYRLSQLIVRRMTRVWLHPDFLFKISPTGREFEKHMKIVQDFTKNVIKTRKEVLKLNNGSPEKEEEDENKKLTFLDLLLKSSMEEANTQLTDTELLEEVDTFMFEGHDTTAAAITWTLFMLGHHPEIQEKVYKELKTIFDNDPDRCPTMTDLAEMKLLERVIKESLRLYPSVFSIGRTTEEDVTIDNYLVPKGTTAAINIYMLHRDTKYYPNPEVFDPDRFLPENINKRHPYSYLPFSAGPRNCIGQKFALFEEKVVLSNLIRKFKLESLERIDEKNKIPELILRPADGIKVKISKR